MKFLRLLAIIITVPIIGLAQSNYKPGYLIKLNGDTVKGEINYREWRTSPKSVQFKQDLASSQPYEVSVKDVKSFEISGYERFVSFTGSVSTGTVSYLDLPNHIDTAVRADSAFLRVLYSGVNATLLSHTDNVKTRYFVMEPNHVFQELKFYQHYNTEGNQVITVDPYKRQLIALLAKYNSNYNQNAISSMQNTAYYAKDLIKAVKLINASNMDNRQSVSKDFSKLRFFAGAVLAYTAYEFRGPKEFGYESNHAYLSPQLSIGIDFLKNSSIQKYFFRLEASVLSNKPYYTGTYSYYTYTETKATVTPQVVWNVYNTPKLQYFINLGIAINYSFINNNKLVATEAKKVADPFVLFAPFDSRAYTTPLEFKNPYNIQYGVVSLPFKTGVIFNRRIELFAMYRPVLSGVLKDLSSRSKHTLASGIYYYFGKP